MEAPSFCTVAESRILLNYVIEEVKPLSPTKLPWPYTPLGTRITFKCSICFKGFSTKELASTHVEVVHFDRRDYRCEICARRYKIPAALKRHMTLKHPPRQGRPSKHKWKTLGGTANDRSKHLLVTSIRACPQPIKREGENKKPISLFIQQLFPAKAKPWRALAPATPTGPSLVAHNLMAQDGLGPLDLTISKAGPPSPAASGIPVPVITRGGPPEQGL